VPDADLGPLPVVEVLGGILAAYAVWRYGLTLRGIGACVLLWTLLALTLIDFDTQLLPDGLTLPLLWRGCSSTSPAGSRRCRTP